MGQKLTKMQRALLEIVAAAPRGITASTLHSGFSVATVNGLHKRGLIADRGTFSAVYLITAAGRAALSSASKPGER